VLLVFLLLGASIAVIFYKTLTDLKKEDVQAVSRAGPIATKPCLNGFGQPHLTPSALLRLTAGARAAPCKTAGSQGQ
jgi:hypothetical protein